MLASALPNPVRMDSIESLAQIGHHAPGESLESANAVSGDDGQHDVRSDSIRASVVSGAQCEWALVLPVISRNFLQELVAVEKLRGLNVRERRAEHARPRQLLLAADLLDVEHVLAGALLRFGHVALEARMVDHRKPTCRVRPCS